ncbi:MAG: globin-coupled sensor protein [Rhizobium sp.]|nr:globin-coupled sensor protein [Rhizobium sp.]
MGWRRAFRRGTGVAEAVPTVERERREGGGLSGRLRFAGLDADETALVRENRNRLLPHVKNALRDLFQRLQTFPDAISNFQSEAQIDRLHDLQQSHWDVLTDARFDSLYAERVKVLTDCESRIGLDPRWHIAGHSVVLEHLIAGLLEEFWPRSMFGGSARNRETLGNLVRALVRTVMVDLEISTSLRFNEARLGYQQSLAATTSAHKTETRNILGHLAERLRDKDFATPIAIDVPEDYSDITESLNAALAEISVSLRASQDGADRLGATTSRISLSVEALAGQNNQSAEALADVAAEVAGIAAKVGATAANTVLVEAASGKARAAAIASGTVVSEAINAMADIEQSAEKIGQIIGVIDEIAFQTNLLALNAGIEAARAGESGRGFAVVAQEVRALAQRSADAAREIKDLVTGTKAQVDSGVAMVNRTQSAIGDIATQVTGINDAIAGLARETSDAAGGVAMVSKSAQSISEDLKRGALAARETLSQSDDLKSVILELGDAIRQFHFENYQPQPARRAGSMDVATRPSVSPSAAIGRPPVPAGHVDDFQDVAPFRMAGGRSAL